MHTSENELKIYTLLCANLAPALSLIGQ
jgi:hypothetical protein